MENNWVIDIRKVIENIYSFKSKLDLIIFNLKKLSFNLNI